MRIIFSLYDDLSNPYYGGGGAQAVHEIAKRLSKKHEVLIINSKYPNSPSKDLLDNVQYKRIGLGLLGPRIDQLIFLALLPLYAITQKYDVWVESFLPPWSGSIIPLIAKNPVVGLAFFLNADLMQSKYGLPFKWLESLTLQNYKKIITPSQTLKLQIKETNPKASISVIPIGIGDNYFNEPRVQRKKFILFLGRIDIFNKGLDILLKAVKDFFQKHADVTLIVAGGGIKEDVTKLKKTVALFGLKDRVVFKGRVSDREKLKLLSECLFYVSPSRYETFGISALEAMACGAPTILSDIPGYSWIPDDCVSRFKSGDESKLLEALSELADNKEKRNMLTKNELIFAKSYRWDSIESAYENFLKDAI